MSSNSSRANLPAAAMEMAATKRVHALFVVSAVLLGLSCHVSAQAADEVRADLQDPVWQTLKSALDQINSYAVESSTRTRTTSLFSIAAYDTLACYSFRMDGLVVGATLRRPIAERTLNNKRVAISFAVYRVMVAAFKEPARFAMNSAFRTLKLNENDTSTNVATAVGLGNTIGQRIIQSMYFDEPRQTASVQVGNRRMISKWTPYTPVNTPYGLANNVRWQPLEVTLNGEYPVVQVFFADQWSYMPLMSGLRPQNFTCKRPSMLMNFSDPGYKAQTDRVLFLSATLNDVGKLKAEGVDGAFGDDGLTYLINKNNFGFDKQVMFQFAFAMAARESLIVSAYWKRIYDTIRPVSVIRWTSLYNTVRGWGGPYKGTVTMNAINWRQYNDRTDPSPEYPSGACAYSGSWSTVASRLVGTELFGWSVTFKKGSSRVEPGLVPAVDTVISFRTFSDHRRTAIEGREYGGVHFQIAATEGVALGQLVGQQVYTKLITLFKVFRILPGP